MPLKFGSGPLKLSFRVKKITCIEDTDEFDSDEPYVLVTSVDLRQVPAAVEVTLLAPFDDVDAGETFTPPAITPDTDPGLAKLMMGLSELIPVSMPFWGIDRKPASISRPDDVAFFVSLLENDGGHPTAIRAVVQALVAGGLAGNMNQPRSARVAQVLEDINGALKLPSAASLDQDDVIGTKQLVLTQTDLIAPIMGPRERKIVFVNSTEDTEYEIYIEITAYWKP